MKCRGGSLRYVWFIEASNLSRFDSLHRQHGHSEVQESISLITDTFQLSFDDPNRTAPHRHLGHIHSSACHSITMRISTTLHSLKLLNAVSSCPVLSRAACLDNSSQPNSASPSTRTCSRHGTLHAYHATESQIAPHVFAITIHIQCLKGNVTWRLPVGVLLSLLCSAFLRVSCCVGDGI